VNSRRKTKGTSPIGPLRSISELRAKARRLKAQHDIQLIVIDYLQLLKGSSRRSQDNRQLEISEISAGIKALAKELNIPIIVIAQLNRQPELRGNGKPRLSDLRESGSIEQDADVVGQEAKQEVAGEAAVSSIRRGESASFPAAAVSEGKSRSLRNPFRTFCRLTLALEQSKR
jgi:DnaB-like helicase C terminal domain